MFGEMDAQPRAVFRVNGWVVHEDFDVSAKASLLGDVVVSQRVVSGWKGVPICAQGSVFTFLMKVGSALCSVAFPVFALGSRGANGTADPQSGRLLEGGVVD